MLTPPGNVQPLGFWSPLQFSRQINLFWTNNSQSNNLARISNLIIKPALFSASMASHLFEIFYYWQDVPPHCAMQFFYLCRKQLESTLFVCQQEENWLITIKAGPILRMKKTTLKNAKIFLKVEQIEFQQIGKFANFHGIWSKISKRMI